MEYAVRFFMSRTIVFVIVALLSGNASADVATQGGLAIKIRALASIAAESALLLDQLKQANVTRIYAEVHLDKLQQQVDGIREELTIMTLPPQPPVPSQQRAALLTAAEMGRTLAASTGQLDHPASVEKAARAFRALQQRLKAME